jgi:hypothetical protein
MAACKKVAIFLSELSAENLSVSLVQEMWYKTFSG